MIPDTFFYFASPHLNCVKNGKASSLVMRGRKPLFKGLGLHKTRKCPLLILYAYLCLGRSSSVWSHEATQLKYTPAKVLFCRIVNMQPIMLHWSLKLSQHQLLPTFYSISSGMQASLFIQSTYQPSIFRKKNCYIPFFEKGFATTLLDECICIESEKMDVRSGCEGNPQHLVFSVFHWVFSCRDQDQYHRIFQEQCVKIPGKAILFIIK